MPAACAGSSPRPWPATAALRRCSPTTARCSPAGSAPIPARCCSTASAASTGSPTGAPRSVARPPPARSNASTRPCGPSCSPATASTPSPMPSRSWTPGLTTTTPNAPTKPSPCKSQFNASSRRPPRRHSGPRRPSPPAAHRRSDRGHPPGVGQRPHRVCYQQVSAGRHLAGQLVTVRLHPPCSRSSSPANSSVPSPPTTKEVIQLRAHQPHQPRRPTTNQRTVNHHPEPNPKHQPELDKNILRSRLGPRAQGDDRAVREVALSAQGVNVAVGTWAEIPAAHGFPCACR